MGNKNTFALRKNLLSVRMHEDEEISAFASRYKNNLSIQVKKDQYYSNQSKLTFPGKPDVVFLHFGRHTDVFSQQWWAAKFFAKAYTSAEFS